MKIFKQNDVMTFKATCPKSTGIVEIFETLDKPNEKGQVYVKVRDVNQQALINSAAKNTDLSIIIKKFLATGDEAILNKNQGVYLDASKIPSNVIEMNNYSKNVENYFHKNEYLKAVYAGDFEAYFKDYTSGLDSVSKKMKVYNDNHLAKLKEMSEKENKKEKENEIK